MTSSPHTTTAPPTAGLARRSLIWAWPLAVLLGFPLGGLLANIIVGAVDGVVPALAGGAIAGAVIGTAQWLALRRRVTGLWIAATIGGMAIGLTAGAALVDYGTSRGEVVLLGAVTGLGVGAAQALVLARLGTAAAPAWAPANAVGWALGWLITSYVITTNVDERFTNFGAAGAIVFGVFSGFLLARLLRPRH